MAVLGTRDVADVVREKLAAGTLPCNAPTKMWVGNGSGRSCDACGQPITPTDIEYEPDFADPSVQVRFHQKCLDVWHQERARRV